MPIDYTKIPTADLEALKAKDYSKVSTLTLEYIKSGGEGEPAPEATPAPKSSGPYTGDVPFLDGLSHGGRQAALGAGQAVLKGGQYIREKLGMESNQPSVDGLQAMIDADKANYANMPGADTFGAKAGHVVGGTVPYLAIPGGAAGGVAKRITTNAIQGAGIGALQPTSGDESRMSNMKTGALVGGGVSAVLGAKGIASLLPQSTEGKLIQSGLKPSTVMKQTVKDKIYETMLREKIPVSAGGLSKTKENIRAINTEIDNVLEVGGKQGKEVSRDEVLKSLQDLKAKYQKNKALPKEYVDEVDSVINEFSQRDAMIPVQQAQAFKKDIYKELDGFYKNFQKYGVVKPQEWGEVRATMAKGIRNELNAQFPELAALNEREASLLGVNQALEKAMGRISNQNLFKLIPAVLSGGTSLKKYVGVLIADHPYVKSKLAQAIRNARQASPGGYPQEFIPKAAAAAATQD